MLSKELTKRAEAHQHGGGLRGSVVDGHEANEAAVARCRSGERRSFLRDHLGGSHGEEVASHRPPTIRRSPPPAAPLLAVSPLRRLFQRPMEPSSRSPPTCQVWNPRRECERYGFTSQALRSKPRSLLSCSWNS